MIPFAGTGTSSSKYLSSSDLVFGGRRRTSEVLLGLENALIVDI